MKPIERVFFHELGHFVAHELNHKFYSGSGVEEIVIHPCKENHKELCGYCKPVNKSNSNKPVPIERLSEYLAVVTHGCFFQAYFMEQSYDDCMCVEGDCNCTQGNGVDDNDNWMSILSMHKQNNEDFYNIENVFFKNIVKNKSLDIFKTLNVQNYIIYSHNNNNNNINVQKLREDIAERLEIYYPIYQELINQYRLKISYPKH